MDVWQLYISAHNGKEPRNPFDLVNFSRSIENTLTFNEAKQLYHSKYNNNNNNNNHITPRINITDSDSNTSTSTDDTDNFEPAILRSPKTTHTNITINKRKRHRNLHNNNSSFSSKSSKYKKFNMDGVLKESETHINTNDNDIYNIYKSESGSNNSSDISDDIILDNKFDKYKYDKLKLQKFSQSNEFRNKRKHKQQKFSQSNEFRNKSKHKQQKFSQSNEFKHKQSKNNNESHTHKKSKKLDSKKLYKPTKVKRALSADPRSIINGNRPSRRKKKKLKPPPSKHMKKHRNRNKDRHMSNIYPMIHNKKEKKRANSDYNNINNINNIKRASTDYNSINNENGINAMYKLGRIYSDEKEENKLKHKKKRSRKKSRKESHEEMNRFHIGDVVEVSLKIGENKKLDLARIRYYGPTCLDTNNYMYGIECFKFQFNSHKICNRIVNDGSIDGRKKLFQVKKQGFATFVKSKSIKSKQCFWSLNISKNALKLKHFDSEMLINACKYGSVKVVKHLFKLIIKKYRHDYRKRARSRSRSRSGSNGFASNINMSNGMYNNRKIFEHHMTSIQTGVGYALLNNHTKIIKIILTHCGSNNIYFCSTHPEIIQSQSSSSNSSSSYSISDDEYDDEYDMDIGKENDNGILQNGISKFYTSDLFDLVCEQKNFKMLQLLIQYDSWPLLSPKSRGLYGICCKKGYLKWIKYLLQISPYIINMPLVSNDINSTIIHVSIINDRYEYVKYILNNNIFNVNKYNKYNKYNNISVIPILLLTIMNITIKNIHQSIEIINILLFKGVNVNWIPTNTLIQQQHLFVDENEEIFDQIGNEYSDHKLMYYSLAAKNTNNNNNNNNKLCMLIGSILSALMYKFVECYKQTIYEINTNAKYNKKYTLQYLSDILSLFMLYGIDFEHMEVQHIWLKYDYFSQRWNINNFPYNVCHTKQQFVFLQKVFKKALEKYPIKLLNFVVENILTINNKLFYSFNHFEIDELINIFKLYIIPYSMYDALMFESLHYYAPYTPEVSSPESIDFMFAYQRSPIVE